MSDQGLQAIRVVGGIIPPSLLARIQAGEVAEPASLAPASYHLAGRETIGDATSRAWSYLRGAWATWRDQLAKQPPGSIGTAATRECWLLILLREFGYGHVPSLSGGYKIEDREYPVSHTWQHVPVHLLGPGAHLDHRNPGVAGAARAPQAMVQELLNRDDDRLWAILSNGERLRLLRDSTALAGSAYVEFDLQAMFEGELFPEFRLMWQLCHVSRLEKRGGSDASPADCWLEAWRNEAIDAGTRALDRLRQGVERALQALGTGFLRHPSNEPLRAALRNGTLDKDHYHRALLRLVYRLLFCFVAEDRDALLSPDASAEARERYTRYFSTARLRRLARVRAGGPHGDLWQAQRLVLQALGNHGRPALGLPGLAGLFDPDSRLPVVEGNEHPDLLLGCQLANTDLLAAVRHLAWLQIPGRPVQPVDYRHLGAEELGSVYESLLELHPSVDLAHEHFEVKSVAGNDRKTTGSYYTPPGLVSALLDSALDPLLDDAVKNASDGADAERRLLALTVCDPACGSGHFLVAAARRIAQRLAQVRSGEEEPTPADVQHALRDVTGRCIYGVDLNDLAAELAKVSLWLEALEPGKPLGFLDARIRVGNSLLGTTPALLRGGVPEAAFKELEGDDKKYAAAIRKRNKVEAPGQGVLVFGDTSNTSLAIQREQVLTLLDDVDAVRTQAQRWQALAESAGYRIRKVKADAWCAAFVWPLSAGAPEPPTNGLLEAIGDNQGNPHLATTVALTERLAAQYRFFHWHLEFPEIFHVDGDKSVEGPEGWAGGFSCLLGNPPWERVKLQEQEFFAARDPEIANAPNKNARDRLIKALATSQSPADRGLHTAYLAAKRQAEGESAILRTSGRYPLAGRGDVNTYPVFAEAFRTLTGPHGRSGVIVPTGIATDATTQYFFKDLVEKGSLAALYDFENRAGLFPAVDSRMKFCLLTMAGRAERETAASFAFFLHDPGLIAVMEFALTPEEITLLNPNTGTCPVFRSRRDAEITLGIYRRVPVLIREGNPAGNPWGITFTTMFHMSNDAHLFHTREELESDGWALRGNTYQRGSERMVPLYQGMMTDFYDHRAADVRHSTTATKRQNQPSYLSEEDHRNPYRFAMPAYWLSQQELADSSESWMLGFSDITSPTNERTLVPTALPYVGVGNKVPIILTGLPGALKSVLLAALSSFSVDFCARQKIGGTTLNYFYVKQLPVLAPNSGGEGAPWAVTNKLSDWIGGRVRELLYTAWDMTHFARDLGDEGPPFRWDTERRALLRAELDAAFFHLYGVSREDIDYVLDTFPIVRRKDEERYGEYRTKRLILEIYDAMQHAIDNRQSYQTILSPPPGHGPRHSDRSGVAA